MAKAQAEKAAAAAPEPEAPKMVKLEFLGNRYNGLDAGVKPHKHVVAYNGDFVDVTEEKAAQLLADFPKEWRAKK